MVQHGLAADAGDDDARDVVELAAGGTVLDNAVFGQFREAFVQVDPEFSDFFTVFFRVRIAVIRRRCERRDTDEVFRPAAEAVFLTAARHDGNDVLALDHLTGNVQGGGTARCMDLVRTDGEGVRAEGSGREAEFHIPLYRVTVDDGVRKISFHESGCRFDIVDRAGLVVDEHETRENDRCGHGFCVLKRSFQKIKVENTARRGNTDEVVAVIGKAFCGVGDGRVFTVRYNDRSEDAVRIGRALFRRRAAEHGDVVGFGPAGGEDQLVHRILKA